MIKNKDVFNYLLRPFSNILLKNLIIQFTVSSRDSNYGQSATLIGLPFRIYLFIYFIHIISYIFIIFIYIFLHICIYIYSYIFTYICIYLYIFTYIYLFIYFYSDIFINIFIYLFIHMQQRINEAAFNEAGYWATF